MHRRCFRMHCFDKNTFLRIWLWPVWIVGLSLGFYAARFCGDALDACVRLAASASPDLAGCLAVNVLPLLISACAVFCFPSFLYPLCLIRGLCFGLGLGTAALIYGSAGFMMAGLLMFSMILFTPVLLWYWCRRLRLGSNFFLADTLICVLIGLVLAGADLWIVSPFLREVMNF